LKRQAALNGGTINDAVLALTSQSIKQYLEFRNDFSTESINLAVPFSLRQLPLQAEDHRVQNEVTLLFFTLQLHKTFGSAVNQISQQTKNLKKSIFLAGTKVLFDVVGILPDIIGHLICMWVIGKSTVILSNIPGPKRPLEFCGKKSLGFVGLIPGSGDVAFGISAMSHVQSVQMAIQADVTYISDPGVLREILERNYDELENSTHEI
jgi:diacylglycerol O-acyltransferase / wax synthase